MKPEDVKRIMKVNDQLMSLGYDWEQIKAFWNECIEDTKKKENAKD